MRVYYFNKNWRGKTTRQLRQIVARLFFLTSFFYVYRTILKKELKIDVGGVTPDGKFSLECLRCVGACGLAPVMLVDEKVYGRLEPKQIKGILAQYE